MVHERERVPLSLEPRDDLLGVHPQLDDLEGDPTADGLRLLGHIHDPAPALADLFQQLVPANAVARRLANSRDHRRAASAVLAGAG